MRVAAVDMGATSVRVAVVDLDAETPEIEVVHRWFHGPETRHDGSVRWRWGELIDNVRLGLDLALSQAPLASIGVDGWAVDYGLLDEDDRLLSDPHSYRSPRTAKWRRRRGRSRRARALSPNRHPAHADQHDFPARRPRPRGAGPRAASRDAARTGRTRTHRRRRRRALECGHNRALDLATDDWATDLCAAVGVDPAILPPPERAGRALGEYVGTPVHLVAAHDTACAFAASPLATTGRAFVSAGTWFLVGVERAVPRRLRRRAASEFLQRARRSGRLPLPQERPRLLAARAVRYPMGDERAVTCSALQPAHLPTHLASMSRTSGSFPRRRWSTRLVPPPD